MAKKETASPAIPVFPMLKTVEQMSKISGIGENKLRELMDSGELEYIQNSVHRDAVILHQLAPNRERIKLLNLAGRLADAPAEKHIEFQPTLAAESHKRRDIQRIEKSHHRVRRTHF